MMKNKTTPTVWKVLARSDINNPFHKIAEQLIKEYDKQLYEFALENIEAYPYIVEYYSIPNDLFKTKSDLDKTNVYHTVPTICLRAYRTIEQCFDVESKAIIYDLSKITKEELLKKYEEKYGSYKGW